MRAIDARESGFSVIETTISSAIVLGVVAAALSGLVASQRSQAYVSARASALDSLRIAMNVLTKEVRQAVSIDPASTSSTLIMETYLPAEPEPVTVQYFISGTTLMRQEASQPALAVQDRLASQALFQYAPTAGDAHVVTVDVSVRPRYAPGTTVRLTSEIQLRNGSGS